ncbi:hypothetical protein RI367_007830 [Sorochytrium milnesiophthora]
MYHQRGGQQQSGGTSSGSGSGGGGGSMHGRQVFVGNVSWESSEEEMAALLRTVGPLVSFRLMLDKDTGKPRGFGFGEYVDAESAASAVRNLNNYEVNGRPIRVDFSDSDNASANKTGARPNFDAIKDKVMRDRDMFGRDRDREREREYQRDRDPRMNVAQQPLPLPPPPLPQQSSSTSTYVPEYAEMPPGVPLPPGVMATDHIAKVVDSIPKEKQLDIIAHMKVLATTHPDQARALLQGNPPLAYAVLTTMMTCGLVDAASIQRIVQQPPPPQQQQQQQQPGPPVGMMPPGYDPAAAMRAQALGMAPPGMAPPNPPYPMAGGMNPMAANPFFSTPQGQALLVQVMSLSPEQLQQLPPDQKATVTQLSSTTSLTAAALYLVIAAPMLATMMMGAYRVDNPTGSLSMTMYAALGPSPSWSLASDQPDYRRNRPTWALLVYTCVGSPRKS